MTQTELSREVIDRVLKYDGLIFDCDGTLTDSMPLHYRAWHSTMTRHGIEFAEERFYSLGGMPTDRIIALLSQEQGVSVDPEVAGPEKELAFEALLTKLQPKLDVVAMVMAAHGKVPMAVASGGFLPGVQGQLKRFAIDHLFDAIVTAEDTDRHKPEPDVFLEAARRLRIPPQRCLVWEDSGLGFTAAKSAGMDCVDVRTDQWVWLETNQ